MSARRHAAAFTFRTGKLANNNQFNYPQNIYSGTGFVTQTRGEGRKEGGWEGGSEEGVISCRTLCVYFPDGLSSLLPDLLCVVLHAGQLSV